MDKFCEAVVGGFIAGLGLTVVLLAMAWVALFYTWPFILLIVGGRYMGWW